MIACDACEQAVTPLHTRRLLSLRYFTPILLAIPFVTLHVAAQARYSEPSIATHAAFYAPILFVCLLFTRHEALPRGEEGACGTALFPVMGMAFCARQRRRRCRFACSHIASRRHAHESRRGYALPRALRVVWFGSPGNATPPHRRYYGGYTF